MLGLAPLRFLGRISYSLYLWHWPVLVLAAAWVGTEPSIEGRIGLVGLAIILATISWRWIEEPFRAGFPILAQRQGRTILAGSLAVVLVVGGASGLAVASSETGIAGLGLAGTRAVVPADDDPMFAMGDPAADDDDVVSTEIMAGGRRRARRSHGRR